MPTENVVGNPSGNKGSGHRHDGHDFKGEAGGIRDIGFHVKVQLVLEIQDGDLIGARANGSRASVGQGIEPDQGVGENGFEGMPEGHGDPGGIIDFVMDGAGKTCLVRSLFDAERHEDGSDRGEQGGDAEEPAPFAGGNGDTHEGEAGKDQGRKKADRDLTGLDDESIDTGECTAFPPIEPSCVDFYHAGAFGLDDAVNEPDQREGCKIGRETTPPKDQVDDDGADSPDEEGEFASDPVCQQAVKKLTCAVGDRPDGKNVGDLGGGEMELLHDSGNGKPEVVPAHVEGGVKQAQGDPVQCPAWAETGRVGGNGQNGAERHP